MASIDSIDFIKKSYCADYGTEKKDYNSASTNEPTTLIIVVPKTISLPVIDTVELNSILINPI
jgi:hypothetical protein